MMLVITDNSYLRAGLSILFSNHFENTEMLENYNIVLYDRGDGVISIIMASVFFKMLHSKPSFTSLLLGNFPLFNYREDGIDTLINTVKRLLKRNGQSLGSNLPYYNKKRTLTEQERRVLILLITPSKK